MAAASMVLSWRIMHRDHIFGKWQRSRAEEYEKAPTVDVTVKDDKENVISAGLASVAYQVGNSAEHVLQEDFATGIRTEVKFTYPKRSFRKLVQTLP